ncbi:unnamed protein product [Mytilus edulis]|uniref:Reverse transcriptase domain-containing protein n=1 Tax=Mytilus edulis TaxID=6550 RepID=A0A8S3QRE3_MYTED|nr:unnamed protein product [Mytilus edulis]
MAEEFIILDPVVENCNVFQDQAIVVKDDGSLQLIHTGAPSSSQPTRLHSVPKRATVDKNKKGAEPNYVPFTASVEVNQQRPDLLAQYNEQLINNQKLYFEQQKAINELTKSVIEIKNAVLHKTADSIGPSAPTQLRNNRRGKSPNTFYDSVSEEESERDYESSQEDEEDHVAEEPPQKRIKVTTRAESAVDHKNKEVQELVDKFVRPENCEFLEVPKVNKVLWSSKETSKRLKDNDRSLQRTQGYLVKGMIPVVQLMEKSLKSSSEESEETFELSLDSLNLLLYAHRDLSSQRRKLLTPALDKKYLALSHEDEKISPNYLFGDRENLEQRMKEIDDSTKLGNKMKVKSTWNRDKAHVPEVKDTYSRNDNFKSDNANGSFKGKSGFKNNFLAKKAQIRREQKKPYNKKGKGNLGYHLEFECEPCGKCSRKEIKFNESEQIVIDNLLTKFLHKKVIEPVIHQYGEVLSSIFIRPKADGSFRLILNLSNLNEHLEYKHFKMETFKSALELVKNKNFFAKLDIKDAYYSLGIKKEDRKFLRFTWKGQLYQFTAMPNGLSPAPRIFTKLLKPVLSSLRKEGYVNCAYIDDILLVGDTYEECLNNVQETMKLFDSLGFTIHKEKSVVVPAQNIEFLGFSIDSVSMVVKLAPKKVANIVELCRTLLRKCFVTIREFAQLIGKLVASEHGVLYAPVFYKTLEIQKDVELKLNKGNFDAKIILSNESKQCINWWIENIHNSYKPIVFKPPDRKIESDSSMLGYGALDVTNNLTLSGVWSLSERNKHINFLELKAAFLALKAFCCRTRNEHVQLFLDNTTAIKYLNKMGGRKEELNNLAKEIWLWCIHRQIWLSVFHIPGKLNIKADALSRHKSNSDMEWMIIDSIFECIMNKLGPCDIDLFASKHNNRLEQYVSFGPDVKALAVNAFSLTWNTFYAYIFPPFSVISAVLQKICQEKATALVIAPLFSTQPWFPQLLQMICDQPYICQKWKRF